MYEDIDPQLEEGEAASLILYRYRWVVLLAFFLSSTATGLLTGSLSTNRSIIEEGYKNRDGLTDNSITNAKYSDLILYFPMNFASIWIIENKGLKQCISVGCIIMIVGSVIRLMTAIEGSIWWWYSGHILCVSSQAYLKNPVTKLASNWFGDKERGLATAIGLVSTPLGILISMVLILMNFEDEDK